MTISIKRNDTRPNPSIVITANGEAIDLVNVDSVKFIMTLSGETTPKVEEAATRETPFSEGRITYQWAVGDTDTEGLYEVEWEVTWMDGTVQTFPTVGYLHLRIVADLNPTP